MEILCPYVEFCTLLSEVMLSAYYSGQPFTTYILGVNGNS